MPKFVIKCYESRDMWLTVDAPSLEAAYLYHETSDWEDFHKDGELTMGFDIIEKVLDTNYPVDVTVGADGKAKQRPLEDGPAD